MKVLVYEKISIMMKVCVCLWLFIALTSLIAHTPSQLFMIGNDFSLCIRNESKRKTSFKVRKQPQTGLVTPVNHLMALFYVHTISCFDWPPFCFISNCLQKNTAPSGLVLVLLLFFLLHGHHLCIPFLNVSSVSLIFPPLLCFFTVSELTSWFYLVASVESRRWWTSGTFDSRRFTPDAGNTVQDQKGQMILGSGHWSD